MDDLRSDLLMLWQLRRRQLDDLLRPLLVDGSLSATTVVEHLADVIAAADNERAAFEAFLAAHELADAEADETDEVDEELGLTARCEEDELTEARQRISMAAALSRRLSHPSQTGPSAETPPADDPTATIHQLTPRGRKKP